MKSAAIVLVLLVLIPCSQCMAQPAAQPTPAATSPASSVTSAPMSVAEFLQTLSIDQSTVCTSNDDCPPGQLCCYPCGIDGCDFVCMEVVRNRCPFIA